MIYHLIILQLDSFELYPAVSLYDTSALAAAQHGKTKFSARGQKQSYTKLVCSFMILVAGVFKVDVIEVQSKSKVEPYLKKISRIKLALTKHSKISDLGLLMLIRKTVQHNCQHIAHKAWCSAESQGVLSVESLALYNLCSL